MPRGYHRDISALCPLGALPFPDAFLPSGDLSPMVCDGLFWGPLVEQERDHDRGSPLLDAQAQVLAEVNDVFRGPKGCLRVGSEIVHHLPDLRPVQLFKLSPQITSFRPLAKLSVVCAMVMPRLWHALLPLQSTRWSTTARPSGQAFRVASLGRGLRNMRLHCTMGAGPRPPNER